MPVNAPPIWQNPVSADQLIDFRLPPELEAGEPAEARGLRRDQVRLMVSRRSSGQIIHTRFQQLGDFLDPGDLLVINTSGTRNAALNAGRTSTGRAGGEPVELHISTHLLEGQWVVELRRPTSEGTEPLFDARPGESLRLPGGGRARLLSPYRPDQGGSSNSRSGQVRLWIASLDIPVSVDDYLDRYGFPIRYKYVKKAWPNAYYQTVYATELGSAEMPSAGRAFTPELITRLVARGVQFAPLLLHTGVASLEADEQPYEETYRVPAETARMVNLARSAGKRVVAVGTTVMRALETVTGGDGLTNPGEGWTDLVISPEDSIRSANALLTGLHEPRSSHLAILTALAGLDHVRTAYAAALEKGYRWHEFGDLHLILP
jgi:S-adenosylmethionine:tRNA ribosyltransferase-isomerase